VDATHPGTPPAFVPDFKQVRDAPGVYDKGGLSARRSGNAWIFAEGGREQDRITLLHLLTAKVAL
jgi:hypothetical protein